MRSNEAKRSRALGRLRAGAFLLALVVGLAFAVAHLFIAVHVITVHAQNEDAPRLMVYSPQATYSVAVTARDGHDYAGLFEVFAPLGGIEIKPSGDTWTLQVDTIPRITEGTFTSGKAEATIRDKIVHLPDPVIVDGERVLVSLESLPPLLAAFLDANTALHAQGRRLFVNLTGVSPWQELKSADPGIPESRSRVVLTFPVPVSPSISGGGNQVRLLFWREPVLAGSDITFTDPAIREIHFREDNGELEVAVIGTVPLTASLAPSGKQITVSATRMPADLKGESAAAIVPAASASATPTGTGTGPTPPVTTQSSGRAETKFPGVSAEGSEATSGTPVTPSGTAVPQVSILIDPGHGGSDLGARISGTLTEKDIVLALARRLRTELQNRGFAAILARDGDNSISLEQRATLANATRPALYLNLHASATGMGVHMYTSLLRPVAAAPLFPLWDSAQAGYIEKSEHMASVLTESLNQASLQAVHGRAALRPLDNIAAPAIAVEFSPTGGGAEQIADSGYQEALTRALANALAAAKGDLGAMP